MSQATIGRPPPGAPRPTAQLVNYLEGAISILAASPHPTEEDRPALKEAIGKLDALLKAVRHFDSNAFPRGFSDRVMNARWELNIGEAATALMLLRAIRLDWDRYWS